MSPRNPKMLDVAIIGPMDADQAKVDIERAIRSWNHSTGKIIGLYLDPQRYPTDTAPTYRPGLDGQGITTEQIIRNADIIFAVFLHSPGSPTANGFDSGTEEEINIAIKTNKPCHVFFNNQPVPSNIDQRQTQQLDDYRESLQQRSFLTGSWPTRDGWGGIVALVIARDIQDFNLLDDPSHVVVVPASTQKATASDSHASATMNRRSTSGQPVPAAASTHICSKDTPVRNSRHSIDSTTTSHRTCHIYISINSEDKYFLGRSLPLLLNVLGNNLETWYGIYADIYDWRSANEPFGANALRNAIAPTDIFIPIVSHRYFVSRTCRLELQTFFELNIDNQKMLLPTYINDISSSGWPSSPSFQALQKYNLINLTSLVSTGVTESNINLPISIMCDRIINWFKSTYRI